MRSALNPAYKRYVLAMLTIVYTLNFTDRGLVILLLQPIKEDLQLTDTQLGFITGIAFAAFYATLGIPIARWADKGNRVTLTAIAIGLWGATVMSCLFVVNYFQLVAARIAAAVGESGCTPPTYSLLGDYFPEAQERTRAMAIYWLANPFSGLMSFIAGGWLNQLYGWRITFFIMGIPALVMAVLVKLTVAEPRQETSRAQIGPRQLPAMSRVFAALWQRPSSRHLSLAVILFFTMGQGLGQWFAAFMIRTHGMGTAELGMWLGVIFGLGGMVGVLLGGYTVGHWFPNDDQKQMRVSALVVALMLPCSVLFLMVPSKQQALAALLPWSLVLNFFFGPAFALMQRLVADEMRATSLAIVMLFANLIGLGLGPQIVGILSDLMAPHLGSDSLRYALLIVSFVAIWSAWHFWRVGQTVKKDLVLA